MAVSKVLSRTPIPVVCFMLIAASAATAFAQQNKVFAPVILENNRITVGNTPDGRLVKLSTRPAGTGKDLFAEYSDDGLQWTAPVLLRKGFDHDCVILFTRDGELHCFYSQWRTDPDPTKGYRGRFIDVWYTRSLNSRTRWTTPERIFAGWMGGPMHPIELESGRILLPFESWIFGRSFEHPGGGFREFLYTGKFISTAVYSDDGGKTWVRTNDIEAPVPDPGTIGANEPAAIALRDGRIWLLTRTQMGRFYEAFSTDHGAHWSVAQPSKILSSDSPPGITRLPDGRILLVWNECERFPYAYGGRQVLHAAISEDEGESWHGYREIFRDMHRGDPPTKDADYGTAYPYLASTRTGKVLVTTGQSGGSATLLFDPQWLYETHQSTNFVNGVDDWSIYGVKGVELISAREGKALSVRREDKEFPAAAVWNFPSGRAGVIHLRLQLKPRSQGADISLSDHYSTPFDLEAELYALYHLHIGPDGRIGNQKLDAGHWHDISIAWDADQNGAIVSVDGKRTVVLPQQHPTLGGANYVRLRATTDNTDDAGFLVKSIDVRISPTNPYTRRTSSTTGVRQRAKRSTSR